MSRIFFKLPFEDPIYTVAKDINSDFGVVFHSFDNQTEVEIRGKIIPSSRNDLLSFVKQRPTVLERSAETTDTKKEYLQKVTRTMDEIRSNHLSKLVLSRRKWVDFHDRSLDLKATFDRLCIDYPNTLVYLFADTDSLWLGATPEILGKYHKNSGLFETMSLAGTLPLNKTWSIKEIEEQKTVTQYISGILKQFGTALSVSETYDHISGNIKHLRTDFKMTLKPGLVREVISTLHPTPAVCGIPKDLCSDKIREIEQSDRKFYTGYIKIEMPKDVLVFVNLRCAQIYRNGALLYVGGGITLLSSPTKEWDETELKSEAIGERLLF